MSVEPSYRYRAFLDRVVDGDTVDLHVDIGFRAMMHLRIRMAGIDAPERYNEGGIEAMAWLTGRLLNENLVLVSQKGDKYGRWLGLIYVGDEDVSVNAQMIEAGQAVPYDGGPRS